MNVWRFALSIMMFLGIWNALRLRARGRVFQRYVLFHAMWLWYLLEYHIPCGVWSFVLAKSLWIDGPSSAASEFHLQGDFGFGSAGMVLLLFSFVLSAMVAVFNLLLVSRLTAKKLMPTLIVPLYLLDSYLMYFQLSRRLTRPALANDFFKSQIMFLVFFGWLYVIAWFVYRSAKIDPLFEKSNGKNSSGDKY